MRPPLTVVAAVIERNGKVLICQRRRGDAFELKWEFPGGKVEPGETPEQALVRELSEELQVSATLSAPEIYKTRHRYAQMDREVEVLFYWASLGPEPLVNQAFEQIQWVERRRLTEYDFLDADREFVAYLARPENDRHPPQSPGR